MKGPSQDLEDWVTEQRETLLRTASPRGGSQEGLARRTLDSMADGVIRTDAEGRIEYWNPAADRLLGLDELGAGGRELPAVFSLVGEVSRNRLENPVERCLREGEPVEAEGQTALVTAEGREFPVRFSVGPIENSDGRVVGAVMVLRDVTHLRQRERQMTYLASHDPLTGLINRRQFEKILESVVAEAQDGKRRHMIFYLDLDQFKQINDTSGHLAGDELLKQVTSLLASKVRSSDVLARLGGDEFGVVLRDCPFDKALEIADSMREGVKSFHFNWDDRVFQIGVSIGVVPLGAGVTMEGLLRAADAACYVAKEKGRNRIQISQADDVEVASRFGEMQWIHRLQSALQESRFRLYWQPIEPLAKGEGPPLLRGEILLRMLDEDGELVPPAVFLPAAERYRLMAALDRWVLRSLVRTLGKHPWNGSGCLGLNLSGQSVAETGFVDYILKVVREANLAPECLAFEISEPAAIANLSATQHLLGSLRQAGCKVGIDDFGNGFASFGYLSSLKLDFLKINGELVRHAAKNPIERALTQAVQQIGRVTEVETVAKWVEDDEVRRLLTDLGVDAGQGYTIAGVEPFEEFLLRTGKAG